MEKGHIQTQIAEIVESTESVKSMSNQDQTVGILYLGQHSTFKISPSTKWPPFRRRHFQMHYRERKVLYFGKSSTEVCY